MQMTTLESAIRSGKALGKKALYFGCWTNAGHFLHETGGGHVYNLPEDFPWTEDLMDGGLLKNRKVKDFPTGQVYWTCGGKALWYAFCWWDRSVDSRGACNSGFYVRGFGWPEAQAAFDYACSQFSFVVERQKYPLVLQKHKSRELTKMENEIPAGTKVKVAVTQKGVTTYQDAEVLSHMDGLVHVDMNGEAVSVDPSQIVTGDAPPAQENADADAPPAEESNEIAQPSQENSAAAGTTIPT
jgi:hypothetical protein